MQSNTQQFIHIHDRFGIERCFNLFFFIEDGLVVELGAWYHKLGGDDISKIQRLQAFVAEDLTRARRFPLPRRYVFLDPAQGISRPGALRYQTFIELVEQGSLEIFEEVLATHSAIVRPMVCITPISDGAVHELNVIHMPLSIEDRNEGATS
jgi:hypothetical protein